MTVSDAMRDWVDRARAVPIEQEAARFGLAWLARGGNEMAWPCPACGGRDRFSINRRKQVFHCRRSGAGGDVIAMVEYLTPCDFLAACEILTGEPPPKGEVGKVDHAARLRREEERARAAAETEREAADYREAERARMWRLWQASKPLSPANAAGRYLARRGLGGIASPALRSHDEVAFYQLGGGRPRAIFSGPAMVAAIVGPDGRFRGAHMTWIDPASFGKATIVDPETGEVLKPKKTRGSLKGSHIPLVRAVAPRRLVVGEGIETTLSVYSAALAFKDPAWLAETEFWSSISLGNLGGRATRTVPHPTLTRTDKSGRVFPERVQGPEPDLDPAVPALTPPETADEIITLGDGDSERFATEMTHRRAAARWRRAGRVIRMASAPAGSDWNDVLKGE